MPDLSTKTARNKLKKTTAAGYRRKEPYWMRIRKGYYLGFRRTSETWIARYRDRQCQQHYKSLGGDIGYDEARKLANGWFESLGSYAVRSAIRGTVQHALTAYIKDLARNGRQATADNAQKRFELIVWSDPVADILLEDLTLEDMEDWRERIREGRQNRSVNRHVRSVVAGLNVARVKGHVGRPEAWALKPLADDVEETFETTIFLTQEQRQSIIGSASLNCANFLRAIDYTGGRPGELAAAKKQDFDSTSGTLVLRHKKGRPARPRARAVVLCADANRFFSSLAGAKLPHAALLLDPAGNTWGRHKWADEIQAAIANHNNVAVPKDRIPKGVSAYSFRHARISELLQVHSIDPLTVSHQTGTSLRMIEKYYFRFIAPALREKLSAIEGRA